MDLDILGLLRSNSEKRSLNLFTNFSWSTAEYTSDDQAIDGNEVELVPQFIWKSGLQAKFNRLSASLLYSYTDEHFSDASNAIRTPTAIEGIIPSYEIVDCSVQYDGGRFLIEGGINNVFNRAYFTRRATGYPGPGIIPSDGRSFYTTLELRF